MKARAILSLAVIAAVSACAARGPAPVSDESSTASIAAGRELAERLCSSCHAVAAHGQSPDPAAPPFRRLSERYPLTHLEEAFAEGVIVGHPAMPEFRLTEQQIQDLLAYVQTVQERRGA